MSQPPELPKPPHPNPWWIPPFLGRIPVGVEETHVRTLGIVALAMFLENFDMSLLGAVLKYLAEDFGLSKTELGSFAGSIRLGALPAFFLVPLADHIGRRRMFLIAIAGLGLGTLLTAFTQNAAQFVACQMVARSFLLTASAISFVIITEEFPAAHRGWGSGMLGAVAGAGHGAGVLLFAFIEVLPYGWRFLYVVGGAAPLLLLPYLRARIGETARFQRQRAERAPLKSGLRSALATLAPLQAIARHHPGHALGIVCLGLVSTAGIGVAFQLTGEFVQTVRGWAPWQYSAMFVLCGAVGILGSPWAGRLGDRFGRRALAAVTLGAFPVWVFAFYLGPDLVVPFAWVGMVFFVSAKDVVVRALTNETFPTSRRGTAGGVLSLMETLGAAAGLFVYSVWMRQIDDQGLVVSLISLLSAVSVVGVLLFPETRQLELEAISSDEAGPPVATPEGAPR